ncbi:MAG: cupin domain-containing protein [Alphaproteobacteria bacterium]|nr:MAG: cupin domain-containing protein [Alphaproteobacteria bacterium]
MKQFLASVLAFGLTLPLIWGTAAAANNAEVTAILQTYADDYVTDVELLDATFGIKVANEMWHVTARKADGDTPASVTLSEGPAPEPTFFYSVDTVESLTKIHKGEMNALTGAARAFSSDYAPVDVDVMEGYQPGETFMADMFSILFHFWTRGTPEIIPFGEGLTRQTHGADVAVFYYQPGFRSAWVRMEKGAHVNEDEKSRTNPFPTLLIITRGKARALIGGKEVTIRAGEAMLIPAEVTHEFFNDRKEPVEGILLMFGEGA